MIVIRAEEAKPEPETSTELPTEPVAGRREMDEETVNMAFAPFVPSDV